MNLKLNPTSTLNLFKPRLSQRITLIVFLSIVFVELILLIPSVYHREQELLEELQHSSTAMIFGKLSKTDLEGDFTQLFSQLQSLEKESLVLGGILYQADGTQVGKFGKIPNLSFEQLRQNSTTRIYNRTNQEFSAAWSPDLLANKYIFVVRYDAEEVQQEIYALIRETLGLMLLLSLFVTLSVMILLHFLLITPILKLRNNLIKAGEVALHESDKKYTDNLFQFEASQRKDELGEVINAFVEMHLQITDSISKKRLVENELRLSEQKFSKAFLASPHPVLISTLSEGRIIEVNESFLEFFGSTRNEVIDHTGLELNMWIDSQEREEFVQALRQHGMFRNKESVFRSHTGEIKTVLFSAEMITIEGRQCLLSVLNDISERQEAILALEKSEMRFRTLIEQAVDAIYVVDTQGQFITVNQQACDNLGYLREELLQLSIPDIQKMLTFEEVANLWKQLTPGKSITREGIHQRKDGTTFPVEVRFGLIETSGQKLFLALVRDVTERKQAEVAMARLAEIGELAAMIVHEIRNPLTTVLMGLTYFQKQELSSGAQARLQLALEESERLKRLLNQILQYAKQQNLELMQLNLNVLIEKILENIQSMPGFTDHHIQFIAAPLDVYIHGDHDKLRQVFINLVSNACEAIPVGDIVSLNIQPVHSEGRVIIRVHNAGDPIPVEILPKLTKPFFTTKSSGNGLGLAITKRIIEAHNGTFTIESAAEVGTTVTLDFPLFLDLEFSQAVFKEPNYQAASVDLITDRQR